MAQALHRRLLVPDDKIIVVLDTVVARELAYGEEIPGWVSSFAGMAKDGYSFSLADGAYAELLNRRVKNAISGEQLQTIIRRLSLFLAPDLPVLPGRRDLRGMLHLESSDWNEGECRALSQAAWDMLQSQVDSVDVKNSPEALLQEERDEWVNNFTHWRAKIAQIIAQQNAFIGTAESGHDVVDLRSKTPIVLRAMEEVQATQDPIVPPMSVRNHLQNRYLWRQIVRSLQARNPYNPSARGSRNDGIDADLFRFLILPALVVTRDKAFLGGLADIDSFQTGWFFKPEDLASRWLAGANPTPTWPQGS